MPDTTDHITTTAPAALADLIDPQAIAAADAARAATLRANHEAIKAVDAAKKALASATAKADAAAATGAGFLEAEAAVQAAELVLRAAERRCKATGTAAADADRVHRTAIGLAHRGAVFDAVERRLSACRDNETALAAIKAAKANFETATADLLRCVNAGAPLSGGLDASREIRTAEAEVQYWTAHQVDIANHIFYPGEKI